MPLRETSVRRLPPHLHHHHRRALHNITTAPAPAAAAAQRNHHVGGSTSEPERVTPLVRRRRGFSTDLPAHCDHNMTGIVLQQQRRCCCSSSAAVRRSGSGSVRRAAAAPSPPSPLTQRQRRLGGAAAFSSSSSSSSSRAPAPRLPQQQQRQQLLHSRPPPTACRSSAADNAAAVGSSPPPPPPQALTQQPPPLVVVEGDVVTFHMACRAPDGALLESSREAGEPLSFEIGAGEVTGNPLFQAFDGALRGRGVGEAIELEISGGEWRRELLFTVPRDHPEVERLEGRYKNLGGLHKDLAVELANGSMAVVVEATPEAVTLDANSMLSGKTLTFELEVLGIERPES